MHNLSEVFKEGTLGLLGSSYLLKSPFRKLAAAGVICFVFRGGGGVGLPFKGVGQSSIVNFLMP